MERVLVGVDGSPAARHALGWAASIAGRASFDLMVARVFDPTQAELPPERDAELHREQRGGVDRVVPRPAGRSRPVRLRAPRRADARRPAGRRERVQRRPPRRRRPRQRRVLASPSGERGAPSDPPHGTAAGGRARRRRDGGRRRLRQRRRFRWEPGRHRVHGRARRRARREASPPCMRSNRWPSGSPRPTRTAGATGPRMSCARRLHRSRPPASPSRSRWCATRIRCPPSHVCSPIASVAVVGARASVVSGVCASDAFPCNSCITRMHRSSSCPPRWMRDSCSEVPERMMRAGSTPTVRACTLRRSRASPTGCVPALPPAPSLRR